MRLRLAALVALSVVAATGVAIAQSQLAITGAGGTAPNGATTAITLPNPRVEWSIDQLTLGRPLFTADGRFLIGARAIPGTSTRELWMRDMVTGSIATLPLGDNAIQAIVAHPRRVEIYLLTDSGTLASLSVQGFRTLFACAGARGLAISGDGRRLLLACAPQDVVAVDADTGAVLRRFPSTAILLHIQTNMDGTRALGIDDDLAIYDVESGSRLAHGIVPALPERHFLAGVLATTAARDAVVVTTLYYDSFSPRFPVRDYRAYVVDATTLTIRQQLPVPQNIPVTASAFTPDASRVAVQSLGSVPTCLTGCYQLTGGVRWIDVASNAALISTPENFLATESMNIALASAPLPPTAFTATVSGNDVSLTWSVAQHSPSITQFVLEAGSAEGLSNLAVLPIGASARSLVLSGVPRGRYFARLYALNAVGRGGGSSEVTLTVP